MTKEYVKKPYFIVIMPMEYDPQSDKKAQIIRTISSSYNIIAKLPDYDKNMPNFLLDDTLSLFRCASFALVDLSFERPSCYYELGILEALGVKTYLIANLGTPIHQSSLRNFVEYYADLGCYEEVVNVVLKKTIQV